MLAFWGQPVQGELEKFINKPEKSFGFFLVCDIARMIVKQKNTMNFLFGRWHFAPLIHAIVSIMLSLFGPSYFILSEN